MYLLLPGVWHRRLRCKFTLTRWMRDKLLTLGHSRAELSLVESTITPQADERPGECDPIQRVQGKTATWSKRGSRAPRADQA
jgi:hypothetical protein